MSPIAEIAEAMKEFPEALLIVDTVSSFSHSADSDGRAWDRCVAHGLAKSAGDAPGLALFSASERAFARAQQVAGRGYYFDIIESRRIRPRI